MKITILPILIFLFFSNCTFLKSAPSTKTGIEGVVLSDKGVPVSEVYVYLYRSLSSRLIGPADFMERTKEDGTFFFDVPEGKYYLVARKRMTGSDAGPLRQGDRAINYPKNPVVVTPNKVTYVEIKLPEKQTFYFKRTPLGDTKIKVKIPNLKKSHLNLLIYSGEHTKKPPDYVLEVTGEETIISLDRGKKYILILREDLKEKRGEKELFIEYGPFTPEETGGEINFGTIP